MRPRLLITRPVPRAVLERARSLFNTDMRADTGRTDGGFLQMALSDYDAVIPSLGDDFSSDVFANAPNIRCRILANFGAGTDHISLSSAQTAGIAVTNTPGAVTEPTADLAMALLLMSARRAVEGDRLVRSGNWEGWHPVQMLGQHICGKTLGVIGMGRIGQAIARRAHFGFGMNVIFHNRSPRTVEGLPARQKKLAEVLEAADFVVIAVPGGARTRHLINPARLARMKSTAHLINVSRGEVVSEAALIWALKRGKIAGAGLDVYEHEPVIPEELRSLENTVLLPHLGTATEEARISMGMTALDNLEAFFERREPPHLVA
ncbi:2-hydroxyacid dehydrogenase [Leisingera thetidis]|uniref:2-hydroxyacid dehydrogenase n=1 Tax=Leisingera thetidis TaxID=2930199 RepID=UPI0021F7742E|nr:D-glycerate dehydrogenase [Leisingera thetidis]